MFYAFDKTLNSAIYIDEVLKLGIKKSHEFTCRCCGEKVIAKSGNIVPHFSHMPNHKNENCDTYHEMTKWHKEWQDYFFKEKDIEKEKIFKFENFNLFTKQKKSFKRIADIYIPSRNEVIEFQHSNISLEELLSRSIDYASYFNLIWVFDWTEKDINFYETKYPYKYYAKRKNVGKNILKLYDEINQIHFTSLQDNNKGKIRLFFDLGNNMIFELTGIGNNKSYIFFKEHQYSYFKQYIVLKTNTYTDFKTYVENIDEK